MLKKLLKQIGLCLLFYSINTNGFAAEFPEGDLGIQLGGAYYLGDINKTPFRGTRLAGGLFYRHNMNPRFSAKGMLAYANLYGDDSKHKSSEYQLQRGYSFNKNSFSLMLLGEFNFVPYQSEGKIKTPFAIYLQGGLGAMCLPIGDSKEITPTLPFGLGVKFNTQKRFSYGADILMVKTFTDEIDYKTAKTSETNRVKQLTVSSGKDWLSYFGIYLSYKIEYPQKCPSFN